MKKLKLVPISLLFCLLYSCNNDNTNDEIVDKNINVSVFFLKENSQTNNPDTNSNVYIYYGFDSMEFFGSTYDGNGKFVKREKVYLPDQSNVVNNDGIITIQPKYMNRIFTIVVVSNYYKERISMYTYSGKEFPINCKIVNNP